MHRVMLVAFVVACAPASDPTDTGATGGFDGPPVVEEIVPRVAVSDGYVYVFGENLVDGSGQAEGVEVRLVGEGGVSVVFDITQASVDHLAAHVPVDTHLQLPGGGTIEVVTPAGTSASEETVYPVENTGFGGATEPGRGMFGLVYALQPNTPNLPELFDRPCDDPTVVDDGTFKCPHTSILVPNLDVPMRSFEQGFPGLGTELVEWFAIAYEGYLEVPEDGTYGFELCSDDGSKLWLDLGDGWEEVVDNDGTHGFWCQSGQAELSAGRIPVAVHYFQGPRYEIGLTLSWTGPSVSGIIPAESFYLFER